MLKGRCDIGIHLEVVDLNDLFENLGEVPVIINNWDVNSLEEKEKLNDLLYTRYEGDTLDVIPSCDGGHIKGEFNVGVRCPECNTLVMPVTERPLESIIWMTAPEGVSTLINPQVWSLLSRKLTYGSTNLLHWLCDNTYKVNNQTPVLDRLQRFGFKRGLNNFFANFDRIIEVLFKINAFKGKARDRQDLEQFINENRDKVFCDYIPFPSRLAFITESTVTGLYADTTMKDAVEAIRTICAIESSLMPLSQQVRENRTVKAISQLAEYYHGKEGFYIKSLGSKHGWLRKHVFGSRLHFSFRAVISSLSNNHSYDEIHLPWSLSVQVFRTHLTNKLLKMGYTPNSISKFLAEHTLKYNEVLDMLFKELIEESPYGGIPIILQRNPTLVRGSAQALRVTRVKTEVEINTISMSVLVLKAPNADFDGDALNGLIILDEVMYQNLQRLAPHLGVLDLQRPRTLSKNIALPAPVLSTISNWMYDGA